MKKLNKKESLERQQWFENWLSTIDKRISSWKDTLEDDLKKELDKSPESLKILEKYLLETFQKPSQTRDQANADLVDTISTYIGQVFIENMPDNHIWEVELVKTGDPSEYYFYPYLKRENPFIGFNPYYDLIPFAVNKKQGGIIIDFYNKQLDFYKKEKGDLKPSKVIPGKGGFSYQYFILVKDESFELNEIEQALKAYYSKKGSEDRVYFHNERHLFVNMGDNYYFHFQLDTSQGVLQESKEIAENYEGEKDRAVIASCKSRVEFWGDEDPRGDYINDHMNLLEQLLQNDKLLIFDFRNGVFFDEF